MSRGAEVGKANGLSMLLDAETFDYTFHLKAGEGFKIAVHHHLGKYILAKLPDLYWANLIDK